MSVREVAGQVVTYGGLAIAAGAVVLIFRKVSRQTVARTPNPYLKPGAQELETQARAKTARNRFYDTIEKMGGKTFRHDRS